MCTGTMVHHEQTARLSLETVWCGAVPLRVSADSVCTAARLVGYSYEQAVRLSWNRERWQGPTSKAGVIREGRTKFPVIVCNLYGRSVARVLGSTRLHAAFHLMTDTG